MDAPSGPRRRTTRSRSRIGIVWVSILAVLGPALSAPGCSPAAGGPAPILDEPAANLRGLLPPGSPTADVGPGCPDVVDGAPAGLLLRVDKPALRLAVYRAGRPAPDAGGAWCYPVALGASPSGDKHHQGDERTPEGVFRVTHRNPASSFHLSLGLDYPQPRHAEVALAEGRITRAQYDRVVAAARNRAPPPGDTPLGGDIYLHGGGVWPSTWTDGCIAVTNEVIDHLYAIAGPGTAVWVEG